MKHLFMARHGNYGAEGRLNASGREQIEKLSQVIKTILNDDSAYIASSTEPRALDSSDVLVAQLGLNDFEQVPFLCPKRSSSSYEYGKKGKEELLRIIDERSERADALILMSHFNEINALKKLFWEKRLGQNNSYPGYPDKGEAVYFDLQSRKHKVIPSRLNL